MSDRFCGDPATAMQAMARARRHSPFLAMIADQEPDIASAPHRFLDDPLTLSLAPSAESVAQRLRLQRRRLALIAAIGDLSGAYDFRRTTRLLSDFADQALAQAIQAAIAERTPDAEPAGFVAIALGKQGSRELNYSSDIDPILLYDPDQLPRRPREAPEEAAVRIARRVVELLQSRDGDGYVLRIDLRLRPSPEATPIALPINAAIAYYESQALPWERAAFIRARAAAGDLALGDRFLQAIRPFIWRRALDYGAINDIRLITRRIRDHHAQGQAFGPGFDLKRGRGGIREIEFFAQIHQLIHGGRDPTLRAPATLDALDALAAAGQIAEDVRAELAEAYVLLRTIEHRLQMIDDRQTHALPARTESLDQVARLHDLTGGDALLALLAPRVAQVGRLYDALDGDAEVTLPASADTLGEALGMAGFGQAAADVAQRIETWRSARYPALRSAAAQAALEAVLPGLINAFACAPDPVLAINRLDTVLAKLPTAINFFRLLEARPALTRLLSMILCHAPTLADLLGRRVELLDGLIDATALDPVGDVAMLAAEMNRVEAGCDYQALLDHVRRIVNEKRFALGVQIVAGSSDPLSVSAGYSRVAEAAVEVLTRATVAAFEARHGRVPDSELVILALGRLGGGALTHASDLDLVFLFTGDYAAESDGEKPLGAVLYYNRLAQRVIAALSVPTAAGPLYEIDTRLRPSGNQGPIAVSLDGFRTYQVESAWTWEHMALTRARAIYGGAQARAAVQAVIDRVLRGERPHRDIRADGCRMRAEMAAHKPPHGALDAKLLPGGLVDLEFAVHVQQLVHRTALHPDLRAAIDDLVDQRLLPVELCGAHDLLNRLLVTLRLVAPDAQPPAPATRSLIAHALGLPDWDRVVASFDAARQEVRRSWMTVSGDEMGE